MFVVLELMKELTKAPVDPVIPEYFKPKVVLTFATVSLCVTFIS